MRRPTLDDVARVAGFSKSAVSLALRHSPKLPATSRALIHEVARKLGYRADPMLAALAAHRWQRRPPSTGVTLAALADGNLESGVGMAERAASYGWAFISLWKFERDDTVAGMALTHDEVGRRAVDWLDSLLRAGERGLPEHPVTMSVDMRWQDGTITARSATSP